MQDFRNQIKEDILEYQKTLRFLSNIGKEDWAFNYWVLDKLFYEEEELIEGKILDYHDFGIDAYEVYEDSKEIFLIQNKYYSDDSVLSAEYVKNDFLLRAITALERGTYKKSEDLQKAFTKYKNDPDFSVHLQLFVTNNRHCKEADAYIKQFNLNHPKYRADIFYLDDIAEKYYGESKENKKNIEVEIESINKGTILNINTDDYKMANIIDARYVLTPVVSLYRLYRTSKEKAYPLFDRNIREYLGNRGINKNIYKTLLDPEERKNFFYYNNGITIICNKMSKISTRPSDSNMNAFFQITNPQIVNGCQTVNSIYAALDNIPLDSLEKEYKDSFVMLKILEIDQNKENEDELYKNIVKYNNSQNSIDEKTFVANTDIFRRLQTAFEEKGFLVLIKQSDKNKFRELYKGSLSKLKEKQEKWIDLFALDDIQKTDDAFIPLEKLLQVITAFSVGGYYAYVKKSNMLKFNSPQYKNAVEFIKNVTMETLLSLYLLFKKSEQERKKSRTERNPISYYLLDCFGKYECSNRKPEQILIELGDLNQIVKTIKRYTMVTQGYSSQYVAKYGDDYNKMIKKEIDYEIIDICRNMANSMEIV